MIYGGGKFIHLVMAGGFICLSLILIITSIGLFSFSYRIYKRDGLTDRTLFHLGFAVLCAGVFFGTGFVSAWVVGYAHQDWQMVNLATRIGTGVIGVISIWGTMLGVVLLWTPFARSFFNLGPRALHACLMSMAVLWSVSIFIAHSNYMQIRWVAEKAVELDVAVTPPEWTEYNKAKYFAGDVKNDDLIQ